ncbi:MAG: DUF362 domain-containing protein [Chitinivibrionales bacterium]|nr:DUF362 domain-containing protein [Chitinivibrionales bacterium]
MSFTRRNFLKSGAAASAAIGMGFPESVSPASSGWQNREQINPAIDNLRVVCCHDPSMITGRMTTIHPLGQYGACDASRIESNMDKMAQALAQKESANDAWDTIFMMPSTKQSWNQVKAAIKVNGMDSINPSIIILDKVCKELIRKGVLASNIYIYDAGSEITRWYGSSDARSKLPQGVNINDILGDTGQPRKNYRLANGRTYQTASWLVDGVIDLLINIAPNKGHYINNLGGFTLTMKNHVGSMKFGHPSDPADMIAMNTSDPFLGGTPPRQQLCIVDSLWATPNGPTSYDAQQYDRIVMGTCSPIVDYLTARKIRDEIMDVNSLSNSSYHINESAMTQLVEAFGYDSNSPEIRNLDLVDALTYSSTGLQTAAHGRGKRKVSFSFSGSHGVAPTISFKVPSTGDHVIFDIFDLSGRTVSSMLLDAHRKTVVWDGSDFQGRKIGAGQYIVRCRTTGYEKSGMLQINQ